MYELGDIAPDTAVDPGTNILVAGPPLTGKRRLALEVLAVGNDRGEGAIVVTTKDSASRIIDEYDDLVDDVEEADFAIVDAVTHQQGGYDVLDQEWVRYASSPVDMTGIGIRLSELLEEFYGTRGLQRNRILVYSLSTLLMYADLQTVFRFLHVLTGRVNTVDALGVYVIDSTAHNDRELSTLNQLFDGVLHVEQPEDGGEPTTRLQGL